MYCLIRSLIISAVGCRASLEAARHAKLTGIPSSPTARKQLLTYSSAVTHRWHSGLGHEMHGPEKGKLRFARFDLEMLESRLTQAACVWGTDVAIEPWQRLDRCAYGFEALIAGEMWREAAKYRLC